MAGDPNRPSEPLPSIREVFPDQFPPPTPQAAAAEELQGDTQQTEAAAPSAEEEAYARRKYVCETCNKRFLRPSSLRAHLVVHTGDRPYACPYLGCTKRFTSKSNMKRHHQTHGAATPDTEPVAGSSTGPGTLAQPAPASSSSSSGHFSVLHLGNQPPPPPGAAGQPPSP